MMLLLLLLLYLPLLLLLLLLLLYLPLLLLNSLLIGWRIPPYRLTAFNTARHVHSLPKHCTTLIEIFSFQAIIFGCMWPLGRGITFHTTQVRTHRLYII